MTLAGWKQKYGIDYNETFAPTLKQASFKIFCSIAVQLGLQIQHMDFDTAYLNSDLQEEIFMKIPYGFDVENEARLAGLDPQHPRLCLRVNKSIYGLKQSGRNWNKDVNTLLTQLGFTQLQLDNCLYLRRRNGNLQLIGLYVDDLLIASNPGPEIEQLKKALNAKYKMKDLGSVTHFLGMRMKQNNTTLELDLEAMIDKALTKFGMEKAEEIDVPMYASTKLSQDDCPTTEEARSMMQNKPYRELVGSLLYLAQTIFFEISFAVSKLSEFLNNPGIKHWNAAKNVLRYLKGVIQKSN
jgi:hypothetical protein